MKLDVRAFAWACGLVWGAGLPLLTWWIIALDGPSLEPTWLGHVYRGYTLTFVGSLYGAIWAFVDGLAGGALFAWIYNLIEERVHSFRRVTG
jgi:hypothetical protein